MFDGNPSPNKISQLVSFPKGNLNGKDNLRTTCITNIILIAERGRLASEVIVIVWGSKTDICHHLWLWLCFTAETGDSHGSTDRQQATATR